MGKNKYRNDGMVEYWNNGGPSSDCGLRILEFGVQNKEPKPLKKGAMRVDKVIKCDYNYSHDKKRPIQNSLRTSGKKAFESD